MKMNAKRICIFFALMLLLGSAFSGGTIRSKKIKEFKFELLNEISGYYIISIQDNKNHCIYLVAAYSDKAEAIRYFEKNATPDNYSMLRFMIDNYYWTYVREVNGWPMYARDH